MSEQLIIDSAEWFEAIAQVLVTRGWKADASWMGGGIVCVFVHLDNKIDLCFGTANEYWGSDIWIDDEFQSDRSIETTFPCDTQDPEACAIAIEAAVRKFQVLERVDKDAKEIEEMFWATVAAHYPEAHSGDFPFDMSMQFSEMIRGTIRVWLKYNLPTVSTLEDVEEVKRGGK